MITSPLSFRKSQNFENWPSQSHFLAQMVTYIFSFFRNLKYWSTSCRFFTKKTLMSEVAIYIRNDHQSFILQEKSKFWKLAKPILVFGQNQFFSKIAQLCGHFSPRRLHFLNFSCRDQMIAISLAFRKKKVF